MLLLIIDIPIFDLSFLDLLLLKKIWLVYYLIQKYKFNWKNYIKIEIKSCAYIQAWEQKQFSKISFDIAPTRLYDYEKECYSDECKRQADIYIFCLLKHKDRETINPLDMEQWEFYIATTSFLNSHFENQKQIALSKLTKNNIEPLKYNQIKPFIDNLTLNVK